MAGNPETLDLLLRGIAVGSQSGLGIALTRSAPSGALKIATLLFIAANVAFTLSGSALIRDAMDEMLWLLWLIQIAGAGYLWLFVQALFEDRRLSPASFLPAVGLVAVGLLAQFGPAAMAPSIWTIHNLLGLLLAAHAMAIIIRSSRTDLIEARRKLRVPVLLLIAGYSLVLSIAQIGQTAGYSADWYEIANAAIQASLGVGGVGVLLSARTSLFGSVPEPVPDQGPLPSNPDSYWLTRLERAMSDDRLWLQEGVSVRQVADAIGLPEHRLRRLINDRLGYRNFTAFINQRRIAAARTMLEDQAATRQTVASIAFDLGFGSLGPFNRAFREATGFTPTEYRRRAMTGDAPIPENPR